MAKARWLENDESALSYLLVEGTLDSGAVVRFFSGENKLQFYSLKMTRSGRISINSGRVKYDKVLINEVASTRSNASHKDVT